MTRRPDLGSTLVGSPLLAVACVLAACALAAGLVAAGPSLVILAPWDIFIDLDEGWRIHLGQVPNTDFHTPVGPLRFLLISAGISLVGPSLSAVVVGNMIFMLGAVVLAVFVAFRRLGRLPATVFVAFIILMSAAARQVGRSPDIPGYVEFYNRFGWVLICIFYLQLFVPRRRELQRLAVAEGSIIGLLVAALFYMKITYAVVAIVALAYACWRTPQLRSRFGLGAAGVASVVTIVAMWALTGVDVLSYLNDVVDAAHAQMLGRRLSSIESTVRTSSRYVVLVLIAWAALVAVPAVRGRIALRSAIKSSATLAVITGSGLAVSFWNTGEGGEIPLLVVAGTWLLATRGERALAEGPRAVARARRLGRDISGLIAMASVVLVGSWIAVQDAASIALVLAGREYRTSLAPASQRFVAQPLADYVVPSDANWVTEIWRSEEVPARVNDGVTVILAHSTPDDTVLTLGFSNIFPYALGTRPPRGVPMFLDLGNNISEAHHPSPDEIFADVDLVVIPIIRSEELPQGGADRVRALQEMYQPYLDQHYSEVGRSDYWILLEKSRP